MSSAAILRAHLESSLNERLTSMLRLPDRAAPITVPIGLRELDALTGGLPRGALSEIVGPASSGRTGIVLSALANATQRQEACALVDASDSFDPASAASTGIDLDRLLWVRCSDNPAPCSVKNKLPPNPSQRSGLGRLEQVLKVTDLLLQGGGFGMVVLDLGDIPMNAVRRVPLTSWFRFRRAVEHTATVLLVVEQEACAKTCASLVLALARQVICARDTSRLCSETKGATPGQNVVSHAALLRGMQVRAEVVRSWRQRKPVQSAGTQFIASLSGEGA